MWLAKWLAVAAETIDKLKQHEYWALYMNTGII